MRAQHYGVTRAQARLNFDAGRSDAPIRVSGYASVFDVPDKNGTMIARGAFRSWISSLQHPVPLRYEHMLPNIGKCSVSEDEVGLRFEAELTPNHSRAADVAAELAHGTIDGVSIGYWWPAAQYREERDDVIVLRRVDVFEISLTSTPANPDARIDVRASINGAQTLAEIERAMRDAVGLSRSEACALVSRVRTIVRGEREQPSTNQSGEAERIAALIRSFNPT